jgi:glutathione S-transferase
MTRPLLYTYRRCPYAMRARMALIVSGVDFDAYEISLRDKPAAMLAASPKGTVPVLTLETGEVLEESLHIMRWAFQKATQHCAQQWWQAAQIDRIQDLISLNDGEFKQQLDRYKYPERYKPQERGMQRDRAISGLIQRLEQLLSTQPYVAGENPCSADLAIFPFVRQFRAVDEIWFDAQPLPATQKWLQAWLNSDVFVQCMRKLLTDQRRPYSVNRA